MYKAISIICCIIGAFLFVGGLMGLFQGAIFKAPSHSGIGAAAMAVSVAIIFLGIHCDLKHHNLA